MEQKIASAYFGESYDVEGDFAEFSSVWHPPQPSFPEKISFALPLAEVSSNA